MTSLAERLWQSRRDGGNVVVAEDEAPKTIEEAIAIQRAAIKCSGMPSIGFKVGSTSAEAQKVLKTNLNNTKTLQQRLRRSNFKIECGGFMKKLKML